MNLLSFTLKNYSKKLSKCFVYSFIANIISGGGIFALFALFKGVSLSSEGSILTSLIGKYLIFILGAAIAVQLFENATRDFEDTFRKDLQTKIYKKLTDFSWEDFNKQKRGALISIFQNGIYRLVDAASAIVYIVTNSLFILIFLTVGLYINLSLTLSVAFMGVVSLALAMLKKQKVFNLGKEVNDTYQRFGEHIEDSLSNMKLNHILDKKEHSFNETTSLIDKIAKQSKTFYNKKNIIQLASTFGSTLVCITSIYIGVIYLNLSFPTVMLLMFVYLQILRRVQFVQEQVFRFKHLEPIFSEIKPYLASGELPHTKKAYPNLAITKSLDIQNISFSYQESNIRALESISFRCSIGTLTVITGPSGIGKSTLLDIICGIIKPSQGTFLIDDKETEIFDNPKWKSLLGFVPQESYFSNQSVLENLRYAEDCSLQEAYHALKLANVYDVIESLPHKIDTPMGYRGNNFSGGERQRIALARALIRKPKILLLDEATSALDHRSQEQFMDTMTKLKNQMIVIIATHQKDIVPYADQHIALSSNIQRKELLCSF